MARVSFVLNTAQLGSLLTVSRAPNSLSEHSLRQIGVLEVVSSKPKPLVGQRYGDCKVIARLAECEAILLERPVFG